MRALLKILCLTISSFLVAQSAAEKAIATQLDKLKQATVNRDFQAFKSVFTDDVMIYGTDPGEAPYETDEAMKSMEDLFAMENLEIQVDLKQRDIMLRPDEKSALVIEQGYNSFLTKHIQIRITYQFVKEGSAWLCNFYNVALIPKNEDLQKVDMAAGFEVPTMTLEQKHDRAVALGDFNILAGIVIAKQNGMTLEQFAESFGDLAKTTWNPDAGFEGFVNGMLFNNESLVRNQDPALVILEQSDRKIVLKGKPGFRDLFSDGPYMGMTYAEFVRCYEIGVGRIAAHLGASYELQPMDDGWLK